MGWNLSTSAGVHDKFGRMMRRVVLIVGLLCSCKDGWVAPSSSIDSSRASCLKALESFRAATSSRDFDGAYALLATSYTNMVSREQFAAGIATNRNWEAALQLTVHETTQIGTMMTVAGVFEGLGLAEIWCIVTPDRGWISAIQIGGMAALPTGQALVPSAAEQAAPAVAPSTPAR